MEPLNANMVLKYEQIGISHTGSYAKIGCQSTRETSFFLYFAQTCLHSSFLASYYATYRTIFSGNKFQIDMLLVMPLKISRFKL